jgi:hypothetical protein
MSYVNIGGGGRPGKLVFCPYIVDYWPSMFTSANIDSYPDRIRMYHAYTTYTKYTSSPRNQIVQTTQTKIAALAQASAPHRIPRLMRKRRTVAAVANSLQIKYHRMMPQS